MKVTFTVPGIPVGKGRPRFMRNGHTYTPQKTRDYEDKVVQCWKCQSGKGFAAGVPLKAEINGYFPIPKSLSKKRRAALDGTPHTKKCDADNLAKSVLDGICGFAYVDDSAVSILVVTKHYSENPRVEVCLEDIGE